MSSKTTASPISVPTTDDSTTTDAGKEIISEEEINHLLDVFKSLFRGVAHFDDNQEYFHGLIRKLTLEVAHKGDKITTRGKLGRKLYIIQSGEVDVLDDDDKTVKVTLGKGTIFGEQSLIFDAPRSSTTVVHSDTLTIYSLHQQDFKEYQQKEAVKADLNRVNLLMASKDLKDKLSDDQRRMLVGKMRMKHAEFGALVFEKDMLYDEVVVIESGHAVVHYAADLSGKSAAEIDETLGIIRNPKHAKVQGKISSMPSTSGRQPAAVIALQAESSAEGTPDEQRQSLPVKSSKWSKLASNLDKAVESVGSSHEFCESRSIHKFDMEMGPAACVVSKGCILGLQALEGHSLIKSSSIWHYKRTGASEGVTCDLHVKVVSEKLVYSVFSVETFERLFGSKALTCEGKIPEVTLGGKTRARQYATTDLDPKTEWELLGGGKASSMSFVMAGQLQDRGSRASQDSSAAASAAGTVNNSKHSLSLFNFFKPSQTASSNAKSTASLQPAHIPRKTSLHLGSSTVCLKIFNKAALMAHSKKKKALEVMESMKILQELSESTTSDRKVCIVEFYGILVGMKSQLTYVLEPLPHGNLRRVLKMMDLPDSEAYKVHEKRHLSSPSVTEKKVPLSPAAVTDVPDKEAIKMRLIRFYGACIAGAIDYMRSYGVAYRELCPENCMFDRHGYPKLVDFGVCKRFPYRDFVHGKQLVKAYTLVGLTDYQAPELFDQSKGHDTGVDQWALGILLYELFMGNRHTPFRFIATKGFDQRVTDDALPAIKKRIVDTHKEGVLLPERGLFETSPLGSSLLDLIEKLVVYETDSRYPGNARGAKAITDHPFFDHEGSYTRERVMRGEYVPSFAPAPYQRKVDANFKKESLFVKYSGDQRDFIGFR